MLASSWVSVGAPRRARAPEAHPPPRRAELRRRAPTRAARARAGRAAAIRSPGSPATARAEDRAAVRARRSQATRRSPCPTCERPVALESAAQLDQQQRNTHGPLGQPGESASRNRLRRHEQPPRQLRGRRGLQGRQRQRLALGGTPRPAGPRRAERWAAHHETQIAPAASFSAAYSIASSAVSSANCASSITSATGRSGGHPRRPSPTARAAAERMRARRRRQRRAARGARAGPSPSPPRRRPRPPRRGPGQACSASNARPRFGGRRVGQREDALHQLTRRLLARAAQHLLRTNEQRLQRGEHLEVLHQHLREVRLAVPRLADQRGDRGPPLRAASRAPSRSALTTSSRPMSGATPMRVVVFSATSAARTSANTPGRSGTPPTTCRVGPRPPPPTATGRADPPPPGTAPSSRTADSDSVGSRPASPGSTRTRDRPWRAWSCRG